VLLLDARGAGLLGGTRDEFAARERTHTSRYPNNGDTADASLPALDHAAALLRLRAFLFPNVKEVETSGRPTVYLGRQGGARLLGEDASLPG
jgi:hypothetical protein